MGLVHYSCDTQSDSRREVRYLQDFEGHEVHRPWQWHGCEYCAPYAVFEDTSFPCEFKGAFIIGPDVPLAGRVHAQFHVQPLIRSVRTHRTSGLAQEGKVQKDRVRRARFERSTVKGSPSQTTLPADDAELVNSTFKGWRRA